MAAPDMQSLLRAVRRLLWRGQLIAAARVALWGSAGLMLLAMAVHLAARPVRIDALLLAIAVSWASAMAWAGLRRPTDSACALWADRHLDGASAFSTLLEMRNGTRTAPNAHALRWLERWATARVPHGLRRLAERRDPVRLSGALFSTLACAALATLVLMLPDLAPPSRKALAGSPPSGIADPAADAEPLASKQLVSELASAVRSAQTQRPPGARGRSGAPAAGPANGDDRTGSGTASEPGAPRPGERTVAKQAPPGIPVEGTPTARAAQTSGAGSGRDAGDSPDNRADTGVSRVLGSTIPVQRRASSAPRSSPERQADMDRLATFDEDLSMHRAATARGDPAPAPATSPPAAADARLSPTRAAYVQAWMKASGQRR